MPYDSSGNYDRGSEIPGVTTGSSYGGSSRPQPTRSDDLEMQKREDAQAQAHAARMAELGYNPDGSPMAPEWADLGSVLDEEGNLRSEFQLQENVLDPSGIAGYGQLEEFATGTGQSPWAMAAQERLGIEESQQRESAQRGAQGATAQAQSQLAMRGGLSGGARERIAMGGAKESLAARQGVAGQAMLGRADIGMQDAAAKQAALKGFVGLGADIEQFNVGQRTGAEQFNIGTRLEELSGERGFELGIYEQEVKKWAAEKKSEAAGQAGGCFAPGTLILLENGDQKKIEDIVIGDFVYGGGEVYAVYATKWEGNVYDYNGVLVTGEHAVHDKNTDKWMRVRDTMGVRASKVRPTVVYDFSNMNHRIVIKGTVFADYAETDDPTISYDQMLRTLNSKKVGDVAVC